MWKSTAVEGGRKTKEEYLALMTDLGDTTGKTFEQIMKEVQAREKVVSDALTKNAAEQQKQAQDTQKAVADSVTAMTTAVSAGFTALKDQQTQSFIEMNKGVKDMSTAWHDSLAANKKDLTAAKGAFNDYADALRDGLSALSTKGSKDMKTLQDAIDTATQAGDTKKVEALQKGFKDFAESAIKNYEQIAQEAGNSYNKLKADHQRVLDEMQSAEDRWYKERLSNQDSAEDATRKVRQRGMNDYQKYMDNCAEIDKRNAEIDDLIASGDEANIKRAMELAKKNRSEAESLTAVKMSYYDSLSLRDKETFDQQMQGLQGLEVRNAAQEAQLKRMNELKSRKNTYLTAEFAQSQSMQLVEQANTKIDEAQNAQEDAKTEELENQKTTLEDQMEVMDDIKTEAEAIITTLKENVQLTIGTDKAKQQIDDLLHTRTLQIDIKYTGAPPPGGSSSGSANANMSFFSEGGPVPGSGAGDTVPAMLTPGEWVINPGSVQAASNLFGSGFFSSLNSLGSNASRAVRGAGLVAQRFASGGMVQNLNTTLINAIEQLIYTINNQTEAYAGGHSGSPGDLSGMFNQLMTGMASIVQSLQASAGTMSAAANQFQQTTNQKNQVEVTVVNKSDDVGRITRY